jgi:hypothetical protein
MFHRDPLIHFLLFGGILFVVLSWLDSAPPPERILITAEQVQELSQTAELLQGRTPTSEELERLVAAAVREEVYYREALARGLDVDDVVVRQRMIEKMRELTENLAEPVPPDTDLVAWFEQNADAFRIPERVSFDQVFFDRNARGDTLQADADAALAALNAGGDPGEWGDPTPLADIYEAADANRIRTLFGEAFAATVFAAGVGEWLGPLETGFGWHLVRVVEKTAARAPGFAEVEEAVREAFAAERLAQANDAAFAELRAGFDIAVEWQRGEEPSVWP